MARIGDFIRPELGRTDYTPFLQGSMQGAAYKNQAKQQAIESVTGAFEDIGEAKKKKSSAIGLAKSFKEFLPEDQKPAVDAFVEQIETAPLMQAAAIGDRVETFVRGLGDQAQRDMMRDSIFFDQSMRKAEFARKLNTDVDARTYQNFLMDQGKSEADAKREWEEYRQWLDREDQLLEERRLDIDQQRADAYTETAKAQARAAALPPLPDYKGVDDLRKEVSSLPEIKDFKEVDAAYKKVQAASPTAAGDMALIFNYMKILDPGSTVREGEFANAQNATGVPGRVRNLWNRLIEGERLNPEQREDFKGEARKTAVAQYKTVEPVVKRYSRLAMERGLNPDDVVDPYFLDFPEVEPPTLDSQFSEEDQALKDLMDSQGVGANGGPGVLPRLP